MLRFVSHHMAALDGIEIWPLLSFGIFFLFFVILAIRVIIMKKSHIEHLSNIPFEDDKSSKVGIWLLLPALGMMMSPLNSNAQEVLDVASEEMSNSGIGYHLGMSDDIWIVLLLTSACFFTAMILGATAILKNLAIHRAERDSELKVLGLPIIATIFILSDSAFWGMIAANLFLMSFLVLILRNVRIFSEGLKEAKEEPESELNTKKIKEPSFLEKLWRNLNAHVEIQDEQDIMTDHVYDGIRELDNKLPPWWLYGFYLSMIFGVLYIFNFHIFKYSPLQAEEYDIEMIEAESEVNAYLLSMKLNVDESSVEFLPTEARLADGKRIYDAACVVCHAADGGGIVGPNFTDEYWLHGSEIGDIFKTIKYGVPAKGMRSWASDYSPIEIQNVATFIKSLQGTTPLNPKAPQGVR